MNPSILNQLKILVERAVRTVRASEFRKCKMREELLAHVTAVFEEEATRLGDERLALDRTAQRFGDPAELSLRLQESVPSGDRWVRLLELLTEGGGVSASRLAARYALLALVPAAALIIAYFVQGRMSEWPIAVAGPILAFVTVLLVTGMRDAWFGPRGRLWRKAALIGAASWSLIPAVAFALSWTFSGDWRSSLTDVLPLLPVGLLGPAALIGFVYVYSLEGRRQQEWADLPIN